MDDFEFNIKHVDLYYKACRAQDELVPLDKMLYRVTKQMEVHFNAMNNEEHMSTKYLWRHQLLLNAQERVKFWARKCGSPTS